MKKYYVPNDLKVVFHLSSFKLVGSRKTGEDFRFQNLTNDAVIQVHPLITVIRVTMVNKKVMNNSFLVPVRSLRLWIRCFFQSYFNSVELINKLPNFRCHLNVLTVS